MTLRVLIVTPEFPPHRGGGISKYYELLAAALAEAGATVTVLVASPFSAHEDVTTPQGADVRFVRLEQVEDLVAGLTQFAAAPMFRRWMGAGRAAAEFVQQRVNHFDVIETVDFGLLFAPIIALADRPPVSVTLHGSIGQIAEHEPVAPGSALDSTLSRLTEAVMLPLADRLQALSPLNAQEWQQRLGADIDVIPPPFMPRRNTPRPTRYSGLVAGRIQAWKGPDLLCRAIAAMGSTVPTDLCIAWAGRDTATAPGGTSLSAWLGEQYPEIWGTRIVPIGQQPPDAVTSLLASVRYVIAPSTWDTFNYTIVESMAAGRTTIASAHAGASFLVEPGVNGYRCDPKSAEELASTVITAHQATTAQRETMGDAAQATIRRALNPAAVAGAVAAALSAISANRHTPVNSLIRDFFTGAVGAGVEAPTAFLENVGIRELASHLGHRLARKVRH
jgi:glycosyltransferase involved in cell wall biosynthesis